MMTKKFLFIALAFMFAFFFSACEKKDPVIPNEEEVITTLKYTLTPSDGGETITLSFKDLDGNGGNAPTIVGGTLAANKTYIGSLELLNESATPSENLTTEIQEEDAAHQFFFKSTVSNLTIVYNDKDADGNPVGLSSKLTTGVAATGNITIILRHEPKKSAAGVSAGDITNAGGETDIEVIFPVNVK